MKKEVVIITTTNQKRESTLDRAIKVLDYLAEAQDKKTMTEIAKDLKIPNGTSYNILQTLEKYSLIERDQVTKRYSLGFKLFQLGNNVKFIRNLRNIAMPYLRELTRESGETAQLGILFSEQLYFLEIIESPQNKKTRGTVGLSLPLHAPAAGKVLLAFQKADLRSELLAKLELPSFNLNTISSLDRLKTELDEVRKKGYAVDREEVFLGTTCLAAPIYNAEKEIIAALGITGDTRRVKAKLDNLINIVQHEALNVSFKFGYQLN
jgi:DNA-binding IclR family transcriptional regulator